MTSRFNLDCLDADSLPVMAALRDPRFKNAKFFLDKEDKEAAKSALLTLIQEQTNKSQVNQQVGDEDVRPPPAKKYPTSEWDLLGIEFDNCEVTKEKETRR